MLWWWCLLVVLGLLLLFLSLICRGMGRTEKAWKRMVNKVTFVGEDFTRKPPKYERFIRPMALRFKKAHVTHPELQATFCLDIISVKKNPQSHMYTGLGVITKGTVIEVNVSDLGLVTPGGKVVWGSFSCTIFSLPPPICSPPQCVTLVDGPALVQGNTHK